MNGQWSQDIRSELVLRLAEGVKRKFQEEDDTERLSQLRKLEKQGQMITSVDGDEVEASSLSHPDPQARAPPHCTLKARNSRYLPC